MKPLPIFAALALTLVIAAGGALTYIESQSRSATPSGIAVEWLKAAPTFRFDGFTSTVKVVSEVMLKSNPPQYVVTIQFDCAHGGYGDRKGQVLTQVVTPHTAVVRVVEGKVVDVLIDGVWDEVTQTRIKPEDAEKTAVEWLKAAPTFRFDGIPASIVVVESWQAQTFAAPSFWEVTIGFDCRHAGYGDRTGMILAQVITHHTARIHVSEGKILLAVIDGTWDEITGTKVPNPIIGPTEAVNAVVGYIVSRHSEASVPAPIRWSTRDLNPPGLVGYSSTEYTGGGWTIKIGYPVIPNPVFKVEAQYSGKTSFTWIGTVSNGVAQETSFSR